MGAAAGTIMAAASVTSALFQIYGAKETSEMQQDLARQKKDFLETQKDLINKSRDRDLELFQRQVDSIIGQQEVGYAVAGVEYTDSAARAAHETIARAQEEKIAIEEQAAANIDLTDYKISVQQKTEDFYRRILPYQIGGYSMGMVGTLASYDMKGYTKIGKTLKSYFSS